MPRATATDQIADVLRRKVAVLKQRVLRDLALLRELEATCAILAPHLARDPHMTVKVGRALLARSRATLH